VLSLPFDPDQTPPAMMPIIEKAALGRLLSASNKEQLYFSQLLAR